MVAARDGRPEALTLAAGLKAAIADTAAEIETGTRLEGAQRPASPRATSASVAASRLGTASVCPSARRRYSPRRRGDRPGRNAG